MSYSMVEGPDGLLLEVFRFDVTTPIISSRTFISARGPIPATTTAFGLSNPEWDLLLNSSWTAQVSDDGTDRVARREHDPEAAIWSPRLG
jgi:hypothetical protein